MILTMGGSPFCSHGAIEFPPSLPTHLTPLSQWAQPLQISTQAPPSANTQLQQSTNNPHHCLHFHLVASTRQIPTIYFTPESPLLLFYACIRTTHKDGSKNSAMVEIATDTFAKSMQPYPSQPHLSGGTHILIKTVSKGLSHVSPLSTVELLLSVSSPFFLH